MIIIPAYTKCPKCGTLFTYSHMEPENDSNDEFWSDGFCMAPMRKDVIDFTKCEICNTFFWLHDNSVPQPGESTELKNIDNSWPLDSIGSKEFDFIKEAFRSGLAKTSDKEVFLRIKLWQAINHLIRKYDSQSIIKKIRQKLFESTDYKNSHKLYNTISSLKLTNLIRLANLLKLDKKEIDNSLVFAEIYRELGDFSKAMIYCHRAETTTHVDTNRIMLLKQFITSKSKITYKL